MASRNFYRHIQRTPTGYRVSKNNEYYGTFKDLPTALHERDRLEFVGWDWDKYVQFPELHNGYYEVDLPPFKKEPNFITHEKECWIVRDKGKDQKHRGRYDSFEEAKRDALIYGANVSHKNEAYVVKKKINGKVIIFGRYKTWKDAINRVDELKKNDWSE